MDTTHFLHSLERELKAQDAWRKAAPQAGIDAEAMDAALRRGREYRAVAIRLALRQMGRALRRGLRSLMHPWQQRHKHPTVSPGSP